MDLRDYVKIDEIVIVLKLVIMTVSLIVITIVVLNSLLPQDTIKTIQSNNIIIECKVKQ